MSVYTTLSQDISRPMALETPSEQYLLHLSLFGGIIVQ